MAKAPVKNAETTEADQGGAPVTVINEVDLEAGRKLVDERLARQNSANEEGHAKNMKEAEELQKDNKSESAPHLGREDNGNTPIVNKDGSKIWMPPGVAGR